MFRIMKAITFCIAAFGIIIAADKEIKTINTNAFRDGARNEPASSQTQSRETIWEEDFENDGEGWSFGLGWELTETTYHSDTHSALSPNNDANMNATFNLLSPPITLPEIESDEKMDFGFWLNVDTPDVDGDGDDYLDDYYSISLLDLGALAWHASSTDAFDDNSYWCGDEEVGGYLDSWLQFMDTPSFTVPSGGTLTADMMWTIESDAGASSPGSCTDGWDAANVRISTDGGNTWALLHAGGLGNGYDFECGYGWIWNDAEYDTGGSLNHLAAGWGNNKDWHNASFDLSAYAGQDAIVRFAFGSDPAYSTIDDSGITGIHVDNIMVSGELDCSPETNCDVSISGEVWVDQFYDYGDQDRPGYLTWEEYVPGLPFNGNVDMDISAFAGKDVIFRIQSRYDDNHDGGQGAGLYIDDFYISKGSAITHPAPTGLTAEAGDSEVSLTWTDMNACSDPDNTPGDDCIAMNNEGEEIDGVLDCSGDGDCCPASWIGDDYLDCADQAYGCDLTCYECDGGDCGDGTVEVTYAVYRDGENVASALNENYFTDTGLTNNQTYEFAVSAVYSDGVESAPSNSVFATPMSASVHEVYNDDGSFESEFIAGTGNFSAVRISANSSGEDIIRFKWYQFGGGGIFYIKIFEDNGGMPGSEIHSSIAGVGSIDGWNEKDLSTQGLNVSGDFWIGTKEFSSSKPFGLDTSSDAGNSYERVGISGDWTPISGNLGIRIYLDCDEECGGGDCPSAGSGDVTGEGTVNVLDIVAIVNAILNDGFADDCTAASGDVTGDGNTDVLDIVAIVSQILGGRIDTSDATSARIIKSNHALTIDADGFIGGLQMTLEHGEEFSLDITNHAMIADYKTTGNITKLVIVMPENEHLFSYTGDFKVLDMIVANSADRIEANLINVPYELSLRMAYPNPFNPVTNLSFSIPETQDVKLLIYNLQGRVIETLLNGNMEQGYHTIQWNADNHSSGVYFVKMIAGDYIDTQKLMLLK